MLDAPDSEKVKESKTVNNVRHLAVVLGSVQIVNKQHRRLECHQ